MARSISRKAIADVASPPSTIERKMRREVTALSCPARLVPPKTRAAPTQMASDIDAMIVSAEPDVYSISSDFKGLQVTTEQVGGKTRVRAMGKINGGGERVELYAEEGDIHISNLTTNPVTIMPRP